MAHKIFRLFFVLILVFGLVAVQIPQSARAAGSWYVSTTGNDADDCMSPLTPCATINGAIGKASAGDTINIATGTYTGTGSYVVTIAQSLTLSGGWDATFTTNNGVSTIDGQNARGGVSTAYYEYVFATMDRFVIQNGRTTQGGGIFAYYDTVTLNNSAVINNLSTENGGGLLIIGVLTLNNSTISGNNATGTGGGIWYSYGEPLTLNNSTIANNSASEGGGLNLNTSTAVLQNTIVAGNSASIGPDCFGTIINSDHNIISNTSDCIVTAGTGDQFNINPLISIYPLGTSAYHTLLAGGPAIDAGDPITCLSTDQRGVSRPQGVACDIGAYEYTTPGTASSFGVSAGSNQRVQPGLSFSIPFVVYVVDDLGSPVSGITVTFAAPTSGPSGTFSTSGSSSSMATSDSSGLAVASVFTANNQAGAYTVSASASGLGSVNFNLEQVDPPANDNFANAEPFTSLPFSATVNITNATNEQPNEPQNCDSMDRTVWYSFTPTESMVVVANAADGAIYTNVNIYRAGSGISDLQFLSCTGADTFTTFIAEANQTYYLQAGSAFGEVGYIRIDLDLFPAPVNDNFAAATPISSLPSTIDFDTTAATFETNEPSACGYPAPPYRTIWYAFTASQDGSISASIPISNFAPFLAVYGGTDFNDLTQLGCGQYSNKVTFDAVQSQTYYIQVGGYYGEGGQGQFLLENAPAPQANFYFYPGDPSKYDTIQFCSSSYDPGNVGIESFTWDFGDGATATEGCSTHRYTADGDYTVQHTVTTFDGRTAAATPQVVQVRTHDVAIMKVTAPNSANSGQTKSITVTLRNKAYPETVQVDLYKSTPEGFVWVATVTKSVPALSGNRTTSFNFNYMFTSDDARIGKVTFKAVATLVGASDALPIDNEAISSPPTKVSR